jgi:2',3'-cyclic-nucleotide 2'-phosphodiesterase (5'-nucleotidase family)
MYKTFAELQAERASNQPVIALSQGDIIDACPLVFWADQTREVSEGVEPESVEARVIILTQACDLANDKTVRAMVAVVHDAAALVQAARVTERFVRDNVRKGQV